MAKNTEDVTYMPAEQFDELVRTLGEPDWRDRCFARSTTGTGPSDPEDTGIHRCVDLLNHSAGAHLCACGFMWRPERTT